MEHKGKIQSLRYSKNHNYSDIILNCDDGDLTASQFLLSLYSRRFRSKLASLQRQKTLEMPKYSREAVNVLLTRVYGVHSSVKSGKRAYIREFLNADDADRQSALKLFEKHEDNEALKACVSAAIRFCELENILKISQLVLKWNTMTPAAHEWINDLGFKEIMLVDMPRFDAEQLAVIKKALHQVEQKDAYIHILCDQIHRHNNQLCVDQLKSCNIKTLVDSGNCIAYSFTKCALLRKDDIYMTILARPTDLARSVESTGSAEFTRSTGVADRIIAAAVFKKTGGIIKMRGTFIKGKLTMPVFDGMPVYSICSSATVQGKIKSIMIGSTRVPYANKGQYVSIDAGIKPSSKAADLYINPADYLLLAECMEHF